MCIPPKLSHCPTDHSMRRSAPSSSPEWIQRSFLGPAERRLQINLDPSYYALYGAWLETGCCQIQLPAAGAREAHTWTSPAGSGDSMSEMHSCTHTCTRQKCDDSSRRALLFPVLVASCSIIHNMRGIGLLQDGAVDRTALLHGCRHGL